MFGVLTDNHDFPLAFDDLAFFANSLYGRSDLHGKRLLIVADAGMIRTSGVLSLHSDALFGTPGDSAAGQIVRRHLQRHLIPGQDADEVHPKLSGNMGQDLMLVGQFYLKHGVRKGFNNYALEFNDIFFGQD